MGQNEADSAFQDSTCTEAFGGSNFTRKKFCKKKYFFERKISTLTFQDSTCTEAFGGSNSLPSLLASNVESISNISNCQRN